MIPKWKKWFTQHKMREHNRVISQHDFPLSGLFFFLVELVGPRLFLDFYHNLKSLFFLFKGVFVQDVGLLNERVLNQTGSMWKATLKCLCECLKTRFKQCEKMFNTNRQLKRQMPPTGQQLQKIIRLLILLSIAKQIPMTHVPLCIERTSDLHAVCTF